MDRLSPSVSGKVQLYGGLLNNLCSEEFSRVESKQITPAGHLGKMQGAANMQSRRAFTSQSSVGRCPVRVLVRCSVQAGGLICLPSARSLFSAHLLPMRVIRHVILILPGAIDMHACCVLLTRARLQAAQHSTVAPAQHQHSSHAAQAAAAASPAQLAAAAQHTQQRQVSCKAGRLPTVALFGRSDPELTVVKLQVWSWPQWLIQSCVPAL